MNLQLRRRLEETCEFCHIKEDDLLRFIDCEWIHPVDDEHQLFDEEDVARILLVRELEERIGVNTEGIDIILHLIDQLNRLHLEIRRGDFESGSPPRH